LLGGIRRDITELQKMGKIIEAIDTRSFINPVEEVIVDEDDDIIGHIVARFGLGKDAESEEDIEEVSQVTASEAFNALQTLKL
jgi:ribosome assembly protein YihI (activator of Der GTPase)